MSVCVLCVCMCVSECVGGCVCVCVHVHVVFLGLPVADGDRLNLSCYYNVHHLIEAFLFMNLNIHEYLLIM